MLVERTVESSQATDADMSATIQTHNEVSVKHNITLLCLLLY